MLPLSSLRGPLTPHTPPPPCPILSCLVHLDWFFFHSPQGLLDKHGRENAKTPKDWKAGYHDLTPKSMKEKETKAAAAAAEGEDGRLDTTSRSPLATVCTDTGAVKLRDPSEHCRFRKATRWHLAGGGGTLAAQQWKTGRRGGQPHVRSTRTPLKIEKQTGGARGLEVSPTRRAGNVQQGRQKGRKDGRTGGRTDEEVVRHVPRKFVQNIARIRREREGEGEIEGRTNAMVKVPNNGGALEQSEEDRRAKQRERRKEKVSAVVYTAHLAQEIDDAMAVRHSSKKTGLKLYVVSHCRVVDKEITQNMPRCRTWVGVGEDTHGCVGYQTRFLQARKRRISRIPTSRGAQIQIRGKRIVLRISKSASATKKAW